MKNFLSLILICSTYISSFAQETGLGKPHNSKFKNYSEGTFFGTVNGVLSILTEDGKDLILDFQGSKAELDIEHDVEEIYDVSYKNFIGSN